MSQFRVLYRQFLFRAVDLELISKQADSSTLIGQFASLPIFVSMILTLGGLFVSRRGMKPEAWQAFIWGTEHFLIATTMLAVGLFAVLSWDSTFPDRRDVYVLAPLPVSTRTMFFAKVAALGSVLGLTVVALHSPCGLVWPQVFSTGGIGGWLRAMGAYWITMLAAGGFIYAAVLGVQGVAAQLLSRRWFLRASSFLQLAAFSVFLSVYFLEPSWSTPAALAAPENQRALSMLPSYWFLGLFQALNGSSHPALDQLARRAVAGLLFAVGVAAVAFVLSYVRTMRRIIEEPDIVPSRGGWHLPITVGRSLRAALVLFSFRTLVRSRQHRVLLAFYLGLGFTLVILLIGALVRRAANGARIPEMALGAPLFMSTLVMMVSVIVGVRVMFSLPLALPANWIFRVTEVHPSTAYVKAVRASLFVVAVIPAWTISAVLCFAIWPWRKALSHLAVLALWGTLVAYLALYNFHKVPFTCSYLPGKTRFNIVVFGAGGLMLLLIFGVQYELRAMSNPLAFAGLLAGLAIAALLARWRTVRFGDVDREGVQFEDLAPPAVQVLGLSRDGSPIRG
jgi:hypothetical protein